jgi:hypothetical protein
MSMSDSDLDSEPDYKKHKHDNAREDACEHGDRDRCRKCFLSTLDHPENDSSLRNMTLSDLRLGASQGVSWCILWLKAILCYEHK